MNSANKCRDASLFPWKNKHKKKNLPRSSKLGMEKNPKKAQTQTVPRESQRAPFLPHEKLSQSNSTVKCTSQFVSPALLPTLLGYFYFSWSRSEYLNERRIDDRQLENGKEKMRGQNLSPLLPTTKLMWHKQILHQNKSEWSQSWFSVVQPRNQDPDFLAMRAPIIPFNTPSKIL